MISSIESLRVKYITLNLGLKYILMRVEDVTEICHVSRNAPYRKMMWRAKEIQKSCGLQKGFCNGDICWPAARVCYGTVETTN
ncbi:hypothetical protein YC2023_031332 [Brassica napus]